MATPTTIPTTNLSHYHEDRAADPSMMIENADWDEDSTSRLQSAMASLDERSQDILKSRWLDEGKPPCTNWLPYNVSAERIRQLEKCVEKTRAPCSLKSTAHVHKKGLIALFVLPFS